MKSFERDRSEDNDEKKQPPAETEVVEDDSILESSVPQDKPNSDAADAEPQYVTGIKLWSLLSSLILVFFLLLLDMSIVATAVPKITSQFNSLHDIGWYGSAYLLSNCALQPLTGKIYTLFSTKWTFIFFFGLFEFGSLLCGAAQSSKMLIVGRAVAGMGGSGLMNGGMQIIFQSAPNDKRPALMGVLMSFSQLGLVCGPLLGGVLTQFASWRWCFYINLPVGAVATLCLVLVNVPDTKRAQLPVESSGTLKGKVKYLIHNLDLTGFVLFAGFAVMVSLALQWGDTQFPWDSATIIGLFIGGGCSLAVFAAQEYHIGARAMLPWSIVKHTVVWSSGLTVFFFFGSQMLGNYYLPIYFQTVRGASPAMSGVYILPTIFGTMIMSVGSGVLVSRWGYYLPWMMVSAVLTSVGMGLISTLGLHTSAVAWVFFQIIAGLGRGCGMQMTIIAVQTSLPPASVPIAQALVIFEQTFGGSFFLAIGQTLFNSSLGQALKKYAPTVDAQSVIHAGASGVRTAVSAKDLPSVLKAYNEAVKHEFYLAAACSGITLITCLGMGWNKVTKPKEKKAPAPVDVEKEASIKV